MLILQNSGKLPFVSELSAHCDVLNEIKLSLSNFSRTQEDISIFERLCSTNKIDKYWVRILCQKSYQKSHQKNHSRMKNPCADEVDEKFESRSIL